MVRVDHGDRPVVAGKIAGLEVLRIINEPWAARRSGTGSMRRARRPCWSTTEHFCGIDCGLRDPFGILLRFTQPAADPIEVPDAGELANAE